MDLVFSSKPARYYDAEDSGTVVILRRFLHPARFVKRLFGKTLILLKPYVAEGPWVPISYFKSVLKPTALAGDFPKESGHERQDLQTQRAKLLTRKWGGQSFFGGISTLGSPIDNFLN